MDSKTLNILVIENQQSQFELIHDYLRDNYNVFPQKTDHEYIKLIDHVRVYINSQYPKPIRDKCFDFLLDQVVEKIDVILMDHILGGPYLCKTGIQLAIDIYEQEVIKPIVFLSKTEFNNARREKQYKEFETLCETKKVKTNWIHKGHFGLEILDKDYFDKYVIPGIEKIKIEDVHSKNCTLMKEVLEVLEQHHVIEAKKLKNILRSILRNAVRLDNLTAEQLNILTQYRDFGLQKSIREDCMVFQNMVK